MLCPISNSSPARLVIPSFILCEEKALPVFLCRRCELREQWGCCGRSFTSALFPIQGLCLSWELVSGENILRIHPVSSREKKTDQKQQIWQQRGREMGREFLFLLPRSSCLDFDPVPATHQPWGFALGLHRSGSGLPPPRRAVQSSPLLTQPDTNHHDRELLQKLSRGKRLQLLFYSFCFIFHLKFP